MARLRGLIFDLDGTLLDSAADLRQALNLTMREHGQRDLSLEEVKHIVGDGMLPMLQRAFAATGGNKSDSDSYTCFSQFITHYRHLKPDLSQVFPHTLEMLEILYTADVKMGVCTNKQESATKQLLEELHLEKYFNFIAGGDTFPVHKPHPDHVLGVMKMLGVDSNQCVMIGDSTNDVLAAHGADIPCLVVTHGYGTDYHHLGADGVIHGFHELPKVLEKLGFTY